MAIKPNLTLDDYYGDQQKLDRGNALLDTAWSRANPAGTLPQNAIRPNITRDDAGGSYKDWGEHARVIDRAFDRVNGPAESPYGINTQVANGIANGTIAGKEISDTYGSLAAGKMDEIQSKGQFSYDFNKDPMFRMLRDSYMQQARQAAANTEASAALRTGGYGNSYGAAAAGQQYNNALGNLYDQVPELQEAAYQRYLNDRNDLYKQADYYNNLENTAYNRTVDEDERTYNRAWNEDERTYNREWNEDERTYNRSEAEKERAFEYAQYAASLGNYDLAASLLGTDFSAAKTADDINQFLALAGTLGYDEAVAIYSQMAHDKASSDTADGEGAEDIVTLDKAATGKYPETSAGTATYMGMQVLLPPAEFNGVTYTYETRPDGTIWYTSSDGKTKHTNMYLGPLVTATGSVVRRGSNAAVPYPILDTVTKQGSASAYTPVRTGSSFLDAVINSRAMNPILQAAAEANGISGDALSRYQYYSDMYPVEQNPNPYIVDETNASSSGGRSSGSRSGNGSYSGGGSSYSGGYSGSTPTTGSETPTQQKETSMPKTYDVTELWDELTGRR